MPLGSQIEVDAATGTPQNIAAEVINSDLYQGVLICDASGNIVGSTGNPLQVGDAGGSLTVDAPVGTPVATRPSDGAAFFSATNPYPVEEVFPNRVEVSIRALNIAVVTTEALLSMVIARDGVEAGAATTQTATASKRLRIESITVYTRNTGTAAIVPVEVYMRSNPAGTVTAASPIEASLGAANPAATLQTMGFAHLLFEKALELPAGRSFGFSQISRNTTNGVVSVIARGFEYTP
jgi:hypothetical protein